MRGMLSTLERLRKHPRGAIALMSALMLPMVIGFVGMAVDVGVWYREKARLQIAADTAALAAVRAYFAGDTTLSELKPVALAEAQGVSASYLMGTLNGLSSVAIATYPSGAAQPTGLTVTLTSTASQFFTGQFGIGPVTVRAAATAGLDTVSSCVLALTTANTTGINVSGSANVNSPNCGFFSDAAGTSSASLCGSSSVTAPSFGTVGGISIGCRASFTGAQETDQSPISDPLPLLQPPTPGTCNSQNMFGGGFVSLSPGTYCGGLTINANSQVSFQPGTYIITNGNFTINGNTTIESADGVTFYLGGTTPGGINWSGNTASNVMISAPTSGPYAGILVYQDRSATAANQITGNTNLELNGTLYFPSSSFQIIGNATTGETVAATEPGDGIDIVAKTVSVTGNATLDTGNPSAIGATGAGSQISLLQ